MSERNTREVREAFAQCSREAGLRGVVGATQYRAVYEGLMPAQKQRLEEISGESHSVFMGGGFFISFAYAYPEGVVDKIGVLREEGGYDKEAWNVYAEWYRVLNKWLNKTAEELAGVAGGVPLPATSEGLAKVVESVGEYYPMVVSHRVHAELAGIGWRGKNTLLVNPVYGCSIRLAGVVTDRPLVATRPTGEGCGDCDCCLRVCGFLKHMDKLEDYRQQCLNYMNWLGLREEVCGRCIKACAHSPRFQEKRNPPPSTKLHEPYYTPI